MIELTEEQRQELKGPEPVRAVDPETRQRYVLLPEETYLRWQAVFDEPLDSEKVGQLVEQTMREYDDGDPLLESYQKYRP